jgi:hypothetical protein
MTDLSQYIGNFNADDVPPDEYELINPGTYSAVINETEIKDNGDKVGLIVKLQIIGSQYDGRILSDYLNIKHPTEKAVKIAHRRLADYALASGLQTVTDSNALVGKKILLDVDIKQPKDGETYIDKYGVEKQSQSQNQIKKVSAIAGATQPSQKTEAPKQSGEQSSPVEFPPWAS